MKHFFIVNPAAGLVDSSKTIVEALEEIKKEKNDEFEYVVYLTKCPGDASKAVREYCNNNEGTLRFYSCGGDGTLNEVLNGLDLNKDVQLTCFPSGSGNDFIKYFNNPEGFKDLRKLIDGEPHTIDLLKVNDEYSINITNFGMDATVCVVMDKLRRKKIIGGKRAYSNAVLYCVLFKRNNRCQVIVDGKEIHNGKMLLCAVANAKIYGGGYKCAPDADITDGLFQLCMIKAISLFKISKAVSAYKEGTHLQNEVVKPYIIYTQGKKVEVKAPKGIALCLDGETKVVNEFSIELIHNALNFVVPKEEKNN